MLQCMDCNFGIWELPSFSLHTLGLLPVLHNGCALLILPTILLIKSNFLPVRQIQYKKGVLAHSSGEYTIYRFFSLDYAFITLH